MEPQPAELTATPVAEVSAPPQAAEVSAPPQAAEVSAPPQAAVEAETVSPSPKPARLAKGSRSTMLSKKRKGGRKTRRYRRKSSRK